MANPAANSAQGCIPLPMVEALPRPLTRAAVTLHLAEHAIDLDVTLPSGDMTSDELLDLVHQLTGIVVDRSVQAVEKEGKTISCCKGCGACCRQAVPVSPAEVRALRALVAAMPPERQATIRTRFAAAQQRLADSGLLPYFQHVGATPFAERQLLSTEYFHLGIPCPFLEDESCSIHPDRPIACREYLVTSPAEECKRPSAANVQGVPLLARPSLAFWNLDRPVQEGAAPMSTLILALDESAVPATQVAVRTGPEMLQMFLQRFSRSTDEGWGKEPGSQEQGKNAESSVKG